MQQHPDCQGDLVDDERPCGCHADINIAAPATTADPPEIEARLHLCEVHGPLVPRAETPEERLARVEAEHREAEARRFKKFTARARRVLSLAQEEAQRLNHNYIGTEHIVLGIIRETGGSGARVLSKLGVEADKIRSAMEFLLGRGERESSEIGLSPRAKKVIELAVDEALIYHAVYVGTSHLLIGVMREGEGVGAGVLESFGVTLDKCRAEAALIHETTPEDLR